MPWEINECLLRLDADFGDAETSHQILFQTKFHENGITIIYVIIREQTGYVEHALKCVVIVYVLRVVFFKHICSYTLRTHAHDFCFFSIGLISNHMFCIFVFEISVLCMCMFFHSKRKDIIVVWYML